MKRFCDLFIPCSVDVAQKIVDCIRDKIIESPEKWVVNETAMENTKREQGTFFQAGPFIYANSLNSKAMVAFLYRSDSAKNQPGLWIANIIPLEKPQLSVEEYNVVVDNFSNELIKPVLDIMKLPVTLETSSENWEASDVMPKDCADLLDQFASLANKTCLHPYDETRWRKFVLAAWKSGRDVDEWNLIEILECQYGFTSDQALILNDQFNFGIALLRESHE